MEDGFYGIAFTGHAGSGFGVLVLREGVVVGVDATGTSYDGKFTRNPNGAIEAQITMNAPAGTVPVQTGIPLAEPMQLPIQAVLPASAEVEAVMLQTPIGPVNVAFKRIRGF